MNHPVSASSSAVPARKESVAHAPDREREQLLGRLQHLLAYQFSNLDLLELALTHSSVAYEEQAERSAQADNEQLEFLGDAVLGLVVTERLFRAYPELREGAMTRLRAQFVSRNYLGQVGQKMGIGEYLRLGKGEEKSGGRRKSAIIANALEAILAAIYLDGGLQPVRTVIESWILNEKLDLLAAAARSGTDVGDYKSSLQEFFQAHGLGQPRYTVTSEDGPDHRKSFLIAVKQIDSTGAEHTLASAAGSRKKVAEQEAARIALESLRKTQPIPQELTDKLL